MRTRRANPLSGTKITSLEKLRKKIPQLKAAGKKIVFTNGCFDILHYGHVQYLENAKKAGDILIVAVNSDASVNAIKGKHRPIVNEKDRMRVVAGLESVNYVVLFKENTPLKIITAIRPDVLVKGADWSKDKIVGADFVTGHGGRVTVIKLAKGRSTSNLIKKIVRTHF
jgi:rfaE bifunctional protein nucleotidyltransferase chain/domain